MNIKLTQYFWGGPNHAISKGLSLSLIIFAVALMLRISFMLLMLSGIGSSHLVDIFPDTAKYISAGEYLLGSNYQGEPYLFLVGPGYPLFLAIFAMGFGWGYWLILIIQVILSSFSCVIIFRLAELLTRNLYISTISGLLVAVSLTAISLASAILSDALFLFFLAASLYLFVEGMTGDKWKACLWSGIAGGMATLVRSISMLFPALFILFALLLPLSMTAGNRKSMVIKSLVAAGIMIIIPGFWGLRNYATYGTFNVASSGYLAAKSYLMAKILVEGEKRHVSDFQNLRDSIYEVSMENYRAGHYKQDQDDNLAFIVSTIKKYPGVFLKYFLSTSLDNATAVSTLHPLQLPQFNRASAWMTKYFYRGFNNYAVLTVSLLGFFIYIKKSVRIAVILILPIIYFALFSGLTFGQGSRIFFPAIITQSVLVSVGILFFYDLSLIAKSSIKSKWKSLSIRLK